MYDVLTTAAIVDELSTMLVEGRIQRIGLRDPRTVAFEIYRDRTRHHLVATIGAPEPAVYRSTDPFAIDPGLSTPFVLLLRKYVRGASLVSIDQPPLERIIRLSIAKRFWPHNRADDESSDDEEIDETWAPDPTFVFLAIELMGRHSNIVLVDESQTVMDSLKRVTPRMSRVRPIWPSARYELPPARPGFDPRTVTERQIESICGTAQSPKDLARALTSNVRGVSPAIAAEAIRRAGEMGGGGTARTGAGQIAVEIRALFSLLESGAWSPRLYLDQTGTPTEYAPMPFESLRGRFDERTVDSMSEVVAAVQRQESGLHGRHDGRKERLLERIETRLRQAQTRVRSLETQKASVDRADELRRWGEAIYANLWQIDAGAASIEVDGDIVPLDPPRDPKEVAADYFDSYRRIQRGTGEIDEQLRAARHEIDYLDQLITFVRLADSFPAIEAVADEWAAFAGKSADQESRQKPRTKETRLRPVVDREGNQVYVGRSGPQNDRVTFEIAGPNDWWLHARGVPGSHVIVRGNGRDPSEEALRAAAAVAAWHSHSRDSTSVEVDVARRRDVRKIKGAGPGMVTYRNERTFRVRPADESTL